MNKIEKIFRRSREKHKLTFIDDSNYHEKWSFRVSSMNLISLLGLYSIILIIGLLLLIKYTPLNALFATTNAGPNNELIEENTRLLDSLYQSAETNQRLIDDFMILLNGQEFTDLVLSQNIKRLDNYTPDFSKSESDSILRYKVEHSTSNSDRYSTISNYDFFFTPVKGLVSRSFNPQVKHFGVDIVTLEGEPIKTCLEGSILFTGWVPTEGNIIIVQHKGNLVSVYKHCSALLKKQGEKLETGDPIGIVGNSGENTTGPHLHFELWKKGQPLNPEDYISFE